MSRILAQGKGCISQDRATSVGGDLFLWPLILDLDFQWISRLCRFLGALAPKAGAQP